MRVAVFLLALLMVQTAAAECFRWPLREQAGVVAYDGDTIYVAMPGLPPSLQAVGVRVLGIDAPEMRGKCEQERATAVTARARLNEILRAAAVVEFCEPKWDKYGGRVLANVRADDVDIAAALIATGLVRRYDGGKRAGWCAR